MLFDNTTGFAKLKNLSLINSDETDDIAERFLQSDMIGQIEALDLSQGNLTDDGALTLVGLKSYTQLKKLDISGNCCSPGAIQYLRSSLPGVRINASQQRVK